VDAEVERLRDRNARLITVARPAQDGDTVQLNFEGFVDGVAFDGGKGDNFSLKLGSGMFIPGFEEQLVGKSADEECDVNVTFPEDYQAKELAGKAAVFKCKVLEVKETEKPELDDEFAKDVSEFDTLDAFKEDLGKKALERKAAQVERDFDEAPRDKLIAGLTGEIPDVMIETQLDRVAEDFNYRMQMQGIDLNTYLQMNQMTMENFRALFKDQADRQVKIRLALQKVAALENLQPLPDEVDAEVERLAKEYGMEPEKIREVLGVKALTRDLAVQKAMTFIRDNAVVAKEKPAKKTASKKKADAAEGEASEKKPARKPRKKAEPKAEPAADGAESNPEA
jgi:trigger factor